MGFDGVFFELVFQIFLQRLGSFYDVFKPPKQKSQISLVFGMNALVPLGTIKTLSKTNLDFLYTP